VDVNSFVGLPFLDKTQGITPNKFFFDCIVEDSQISKTKKPKMATW
jgi:hypothetical protein